MRIFYTRSHKRRPICWDAVPVLWDMQAVIPAGWCSRCGAEVYRPGRSLCDRCRKEKKDE